MNRVLASRFHLFCGCNRIPLLVNIVALESFIVSGNDNVRLTLSKYITLAIFTLEDAYKLCL